MNVLYVDLDATRADPLGCCGQARPAPPHLDAIAAEAPEMTTGRSVERYLARLRATGRDAEADVVAARLAAAQGGEAPP